ncbi:MAG TPA: potassium channel protein [Caulobacteraceae bacterium]|nr:potassium channel protein [Caulobacteraceae bacterium]
MNTNVSGLFGSPLRNLIAVVVFMLVLIVACTAGYMANGWSFSDAFYMVILTVFTVGYGEVRPVNTPALHVLTVSMIVFGCTGMIFLTGALVQVFTVGQITQLLGLKRVNSEIEKLKDHVIICGFGRIGVMLAKELKDGGAPFMILERNESRIAQAEALGYLCLQADAADEAALLQAGVERAWTLATVLPDDSMNVFVTLSARRLNPKIQIIARGEAPTTESKLVYAGADKVVLPTHIGAERMAEMILFPETARFIRGSERMLDFDKTLRDLGLQLELITVPNNSGAVGQTVGELENKARGGFFIVQLDRHGGETHTRPGPDVKIEAGDGVLIVLRGELANVVNVLKAPSGPVRAGRTRF